MEEKEKRKKGKERGKGEAEDIREGIPSAPVLSDFVQGIRTIISIINGLDSYFSFG